LLYVGVSQGPYRWLKRKIGVERSDWLKRVLRLREASEAVFFKSGYPRLDEGARRRLQARFEEDRQRLERLDLIDTSHWRVAG
jgi:hypothetical protein